MNDQNAGLGGSYVLDPATSQRTLVERTGSNPVAADVPVARAPAPPANSKPPKATTPPAE